MPLLISTVAVFQAQNRETLNSTLKVAVSFKIIIDDDLDKIVFQKKQQNNCKTKTKASFVDLRSVLP